MLKRFATASWILVLSVTLIPLVGRAWSDDPLARDAFPANSVWVNETMDLTLTVLERKEETFRGKLVIGQAIERTLIGTVKGNTVAWLAKDVHATKGGPGSDNTGTINGGRIDIVYSGKGGTGAYAVHRSDGRASGKQGSPAPGTPPKLDESSFERWRDLLQPKDKELKWMKIGWRPYFWEAVIEAQDKEKPILVWGMNGNPCGFT